MKKSLKIIWIMLLVILLLNVTSNAQSFEFEPDPTEKVVEPGETVEIKLSVKDIEDIEEGINTIVGYLEYEEDFFDSISFDGKEKWTVTYNNRVNSGLYGKFAITTMQNGILEDTDIATLTVKLKSSLTDGETKIEFKNLVSSDGYNSIEAENKTVRLIIKNQEKNQVPEKEQTSTNKPTNTPTGDQIFMYVGIIVVVIVIWIVALIITKKKDKKEKNEKQ